MNKYDEYLNACEDFKKSIDWNELPNGPLYENDTMNISIAHCQKLQLVRVGQQCEGGKNYWPSPSALNNAIMQVIIEDKTIIERAINKLHDKRTELLLETQSFINELQDKINFVTEQNKPK